VLRDAPGSAGDTLKERGTSRAYILARLDRDGFTELAEQVRAGERAIERPSWRATAKSHRPS